MLNQSFGARYMHTRTLGRRPLRATLVCALLGLAVITAETQAFGTPQIGSLSDSTLSRSGRLLVFGANFGADPTNAQVLIDGQAAIVTQWSSSEIHTYVPEGASVGAVPVQVVTSSGASNIVMLNGTLRQAAGRVRWRFQMDSDFAGRFFTIAPDGTVYASDLTRLYALSPNGGLLWVTQEAT